MYKKSILWGAIFLCVIINTPSMLYAGEVTPCSLRYTQNHHYPVLLAKGKKALKDWGIVKQWGIEDRTAFLPTVSPLQTNIIRVFFPKGSINPDNKEAPRGGIGFYANNHFVKGTKAACLQYKVFFPKDFEFVRGGKLPGLYGGKPASGCRDDAGITGFSTRYMWRKEGIGTLYAYLPDRKEHCGELMGLNSWRFTKGIWTTLEQEIVLNTPNKEDGVMRVWVDGKQVINEEKAQLRLSEHITIEGIFFNSFFGGKDKSWASPKDQFAEFADFSVYFP